MAELDKPEFKFPDEMEEEHEEISIEIRDDTPPEDQGKEPLPDDIKEDLYNDDLEDYSAKVKKKLVQMKKLAHDERREKERALREQQEAVTVAQRILQENNRLKSSLQEREKDVLASIQRAVDLELSEAKRKYKEAYDSGESDRVIEAQEAMTQAAMKADKVKNYRPAPPEPEYEIPQPRTPQVQQDPIAVKWRENNSWFGNPDEEEMTSLALGLHSKLEKEGVVISSPEYYRRIDETMRKRFPEKFESDTSNQRASNPTRSVVVAPATRSTAPKKVTLSPTQIALSKKWGITPEQYAREVLKLEAKNG
jgi:hypothetical protein